METRLPDIRILQRLIQIPSVTGSETAIERYILGYFQRLGLSNEDAFLQGGKNVVVHLHGKRHDKAMMFIPHVDTVDLEDDDKWKHKNAVSGVIEDGKLYGRGACDTKAGVFAAMEVAKELLERKQRGDELPYDAFFVFPVGEETDGNGTRDFGKCFQQIYGTQYKELSAIFLEPTNLEVKFGHRGNLIFHTEAKSDVSKTGIERSLEFLKQAYAKSEQWTVEQQNHLFGATLVNATNINSVPSEKKYQPKGRIVRIISEGEQMHVSLTENSSTAQLSVKKLIDFISDMKPEIKPIAIRSEKTVTNKTPSKIELDIEIPEGKEELLAHLTALSQKNGVTVISDISPNDYLPYGETVESDIDVRTIPNHHQEAREKITQVISALGIIYQEQPDTPYGTTDPEAPIIKAYMKAVAGIIKPIIPGIFTAASDMGVLQSLRGIFEKLHAVIFGAGDLGIAHKIDEYVPLKQVYQSINILLNWYYAWT